MYSLTELHPANVGR